MAENDVTEPSQLKESWELLDQAVSRLEAAQAAHAKKLAQEETSVLDDSKHLQEENRALQDVNNTVSKQLDGVINRLKSVLEV